MTDNLPKWYHCVMDAASHKMLPILPGDGITFPMGTGYGLVVASDNMSSAYDTTNEESYPTQRVHLYYKGQILGLTLDLRGYNVLWMIQKHNKLSSI
jgi:hypothetical protein